MFGYATDETEECMPLTVTLSHNLNKKLAELRRDGTLWWARPDSKTQVISIYQPLIRGFKEVCVLFTTRAQSLNKNQKEIK